MELCDLNLLDIIEYMKDRNNSNVGRLSETDRRLFLDFRIILAIMKNLKQAFQHINLINPILCHRDVKPDNILINVREGKVQAKLPDWGFAREIQERNTLTHVGNNIYRDPVIKKQEGYDVSVDIWFTGIVFFQLLYKGLLLFLNPAPQGK